MVMAPSGTPAPVIAAVHAALGRAVTVLTDRLTEMAMEVVPNSNPASATAFLASEMAKWEPIIRAAGIRAD